MRAQDLDQPRGLGGVLRGVGARAGIGQAVEQLGGFVQADLSTNSLIITAPEPLYRQVRAVIEQLDATTLVPPGATATVDKALNILIAI